MPVTFRIPSGKQLFIGGSAWGANNHKNTQLLVHNCQKAFWYLEKYACFLWQLNFLSILKLSGTTNFQHQFENCAGMELTFWSPKRKTALWVNVAMWPGRTAIVGPGNGVWRHWLHHHLLNNHHLAYLLGWWFVVFCNCLWLPDTVRCRLHVGFCQYAHNGLTVSMLIRASLRGLYLLLLRCHWQTLTFV
jgi:hypothetical protein